MKKEEKKNEKKNIVVQGLRKLLKKVWEKIEKIMLYLYPEIGKIPKKTEKRVRLKWNDIIKLIILLLLPIVITVSYIYLPLKEVNVLLLSSYITIMIVKIIKISKRKLNKRIFINLIINLIILFFLVRTVFN